MKTLYLVAALWVLASQAQAATAKKVKSAKKPVVAAKTQVESEEEENPAKPAPKRFILDNGNPPPGQLLISPMVGQYAILGTEFGVRVSYRVADGGFISSINNSVSVEGDVFHGRFRTLFFGDNESLYTSVVGRWDFHLHPRWTPYVAAGIDYEYEMTVADQAVGGGVLEPTMQIGAMFHVSDSFRLRGEYDRSRASLRIGCALAL